MAAHKSEESCRRNEKEPTENEIIGVIYKYQILESKRMFSCDVIDLSGNSLE